MSKGVGVLTRTFGDTIMINTLSRNIKLKYDTMELDWIVEESYVDVIKQNPDIKNVITVKNTVLEWDYILGVISKGYDEVFMFQQVCGEDNVWHQNDKYRGGHLLDFYVKRGKIKLVDRKLRWYQDKNVVWMQLEEGKRIFIHDTTLGDSKNWDRFKDLVIDLRNCGFIVYQIGLKSDISIDLEEKYDLRGKFSIQELAGMLKNECDCFVGLDSGISYMAAAVGVPVICIMGASIPTTSGPFGEKVVHIVSDTREECKSRRCHSLFNKCRFGEKCINTIKVEDVVSKVKEITLGKDEKVLSNL